MRGRQPLGEHSPSLTRCQSPCPGLFALSLTKVLSKTCRPLFVDVTEAWLGSTEVIIQLSLLLNILPFRAFSSTNSSQSLRDQKRTGGGSQQIKTKSLRTDNQKSVGMLPLALQADILWVPMVPLAPGICSTFPEANPSYRNLKHFCLTQEPRSLSWVLLPPGITCYGTLVCVWCLKHEVTRDHAPDGTAL